MPDEPSEATESGTASVEKPATRNRRSRSTASKAEPEAEVISTPEKPAGSKPTTEPPQQKVLTENVSVADGLVPLRQRRPSDYEDRVRTWLAIALTALLFGLAGLAAAGWMWGGKTENDLKAYMLIMSPIITLTGPILGFYFSSRRR